MADYLELAIAVYAELAIDVTDCQELGIFVSDYQELSMMWQIS